MNASQPPPESDSYNPPALRPGESSGKFRPSGTLLTTLLAPVVFGVLVLLMWSLAVWYWKLPKLILPTPTDVLSAGWEQRGSLFHALLKTSVEVLTAYFLSIVLAGGLAICFGQSRLLRKAAYPYAIFLKTLPIIAIAPLVVLWIGQGTWGVVAVAGIVSFLPILTNTTEGLLAVPANLQDLMRLYGASRWQRLIKVQIPNALPMFVAGCKIASVGCVLGAVVGEIFVGTVSNPGLGFLIYGKRDSDTAGMFVAIALSGLLGLALFGLTSVLGERLLLYWRDPSVDAARDR
ncbi:MAG: ABC transporter permease [Pirellulaceae bacterium]